MRYVVTIKLPRNPDHDPRNKKTGICPASQFCTDVTGQHHSYLTEGTDADAVRAEARSLGFEHVTRIEAV